MHGLQPTMQLFRAFPFLLVHSPMRARACCEGTAFPFYQTHSFSLAFPAPQGIRTLSYPSPLLFPFFSPTFVLLVYSYSWNSSIYLFDLSTFTSEIIS